MIGRGNYGPGEIVDFSVNTGEDITPEIVTMGEVVDFTIGNIGDIFENEETDV